MIAYFLLSATARAASCELVCSNVCDDAGGTDAVYHFVSGDFTSAQRADIINAGLTHPFPVWRVSEILSWVESGEYGRLVNGAAESAAA